MNLPETSRGSLPQRWKNKFGNGAKKYAITNKNEITSNSRKVPVKNANHCP